MDEATWKRSFEGLRRSYASLREAEDQMADFPVDAPMWMREALVEHVAELRERVAAGALALRESPTSSEVTLHG